MKESYLHIYMGEGKGKSTCATGLAMRAVCQGLRVGYIQFLKNAATAEAVALTRLGATVLAPQGTFNSLQHLTPEEREACAQRQQKTLDTARSIWTRFDLLVLDEAITAMNMDMLQEKDLVAFVKERPAAMELVLTGVNPGETLCALADYLTEMKLLAHPSQQGAAPRKGIEF